METKSWELSRDKKEVILNESQKFNLYNKYVYDQKEGFEVLMNFINDLVNHLREEGKVSDFFEIRARIKAPQSAIDNDEHKVLDDVFGMEIIAATEEELKKIMKSILTYMDVIREKNHDKKNGYKASHKLLNFKPDKFSDLNVKCLESEIPIIEIQFKTMEVAVKTSGGTADHMLYKGEKKEDVQKKYDNNGYSIFTNIPTMWVSKDGKMIMLSPDEILKKMYPFLRLKEKDEKKGEK